MRKPLLKIELHTEQISLMKDILLYSGKVKIAGFGIFSLRDIPARTYFSVIAKKQVTVPKHKRVNFQPLQSLRRDLQKLCLK